VLACLETRNASVSLQEIFLAGLLLASKSRFVRELQIMCSSARHIYQDVLGKIEGLQPLLTYLLTPWSRVLLEKLTGLLLVKKFPAFYETRRFITAFTSARHLTLS
jgi:hypothetical protein